MLSLKRSRLSCPAPFIFRMSLCVCGVCIGTFSTILVCIFSGVTIERTRYRKLYLKFLHGFSYSSVNTDAAYCQLTLYNFKSSRFFETEIHDTTEWMKNISSCCVSDTVYCSVNQLKYAYPGMISTAVHTMRNFSSMNIFIHTMRNFSIGFLRKKKDFSSSLSSLLS